MSSTDVGISRIFFNKKKPGEFPGYRFEGGEMHSKLLIGGD